MSGPTIFNLTKSTGSNTVTFTWSTDELASAKVFYNTSPVTMSEGDINSVGFGATSGYTATNDSLARQSQQVIINNLNANTRYYYVIVATDLKGNVSVWNPNTTFTTNP
jgi:chitodextrinase